MVTNWLCHNQILERHHQTNSSNYYERCKSSLELACPKCIRIDLRRTSLTDPGHVHLSNISSLKRPATSPHSDSNTSSKRMHTNRDPSPKGSREDGHHLAMSQPDLGTSRSNLEWSEGETPETEDGRFSICFSQPIHLDHLLLGSQLVGTPGNSQTPMQRLVRRMTRFFVKTNCDETMQELFRTLSNVSGYNIRKSAPGQLTVVTTDRRKMQLVFKAHILEMGENVLVDFRLSKGDGIEFKRHFLKIRDGLPGIINKIVPSTAVQL